MLTITLRQADGSEKTYTQDFISGRKFRKTIEMQKLLKGGVDESAMDNMVGYVCMLFDNQFSIDDFYDGIAANKMLETIVGYVNSVTGDVSKAVGAQKTDPN